jgi:hypothetical protein
MIGVNAARHRDPDSEPPQWWIAGIGTRPGFENLSTQIVNDSLSTSVRESGNPSNAFTRAAAPVGCKPSKRERRNHAR